VTSTMLAFCTPTSSAAPVVAYIVLIVYVLTGACLPTRQSRRASTSCGYLRTGRTPASSCRRRRVLPRAAAALQLQRFINTSKAQPGENKMCAQLLPPTQG